MDLILSLVIGAVAGWLGNMIMKGGSSGLLWNLILGVLGGCFGGWLFGILGINFGGIIGSLICAVLGAMILIWLVRLIKK